MVEFHPYDSDRPSVDPLAPPRFQAFDWEQVFADLDGPEAEADCERLVHAFKAFLGWLWANRQDVDRATPEAVGRRAIAAMTVLSGESGAALCRKMRRSHAYLSGPAAEFSRTFGVLSRAQAHGRNGQHADKLKVNFAPPVSFQVPIKTEQGLSVGRADASGEAQTPPEAQDAPTGTQEALP
jgi:hypothetical protein